MPALRARLWRREFLSQLSERRRDDFVDRDELSDLDFQEEVAQEEFRNIGLVLGQLSQVEVGVRQLAQRQLHLSAKAAGKPTISDDRDSTRTRTFYDDIETLRSSLGGRYLRELRAIEEVRHLRNHLVHGEILIGVSSLSFSAPSEHVITLILGERPIPREIHEADPLRDLLTGDFDLQQAMAVASEGLDALITIMLATDFPPYGDTLAP